MKKRGRKKKGTTDTSKKGKVIKEESDEEKKDESFSNNLVSTNGKDTSVSFMDLSSNSSIDNKSMFKMPLMERLKKKNMKIDGMSSFKLTSFGKKAKRSGLEELSDIELDFDDKNKFL